MTFKVCDVYVTVIKVIKKYITAKITHLCRKKCQKCPYKSGLVLKIEALVRAFLKGKADCASF